MSALLFKYLDMSKLQQKACFYALENRCLCELWRPRLSQNVLQDGGTKGIVFMHGLEARDAF